MVDWRKREELKMTFITALPAILLEGINIVTLPIIIDTIITATVTITALVLAILAYRNTRKILKKLEEMKK